MKLAFFDDFKLGVVKGDVIHDVSAVVKDIPHVGPGDLISSLIAKFGDYKAKLEAAATGAGTPLASVRIRPPLPKPGNIVCMAVNYMENGTLPKKPQINAFHKAATAVIGHGDTMVLPDEPATIFEGEAEMALVIGKRADNVPASEAMNYIFGYMNFIDGSARGLPSPGFFAMKSRATFAPIGPFLVTADEIADPQNLPIKLTVNGETKQDFNTNDMAHNIARCIEWVSSVHVLEPGDILATGTNHRGLSSFMDGDVVELETQGLGKLRFNIRDDLKRTWLRETRQDRIALAGDSAGGGLVIGALLAIREAGLTLPACGWCISPWVDMEALGHSYIDRAESDPTVQRPTIQMMAQWYMGDGDPRHPHASPINGDLRGLPPLFIQVGSVETLLDDSIALARKAGIAEVPVELHIWPEMIHIWHIYFPMLDAGRRAIAAGGSFLSKIKGE